MYCKLVTGDWLLVTSDWQLATSYQKPETRNKQKNELQKFRDLGKVKSTKCSYS